MPTKYKRKPKSKEVLALTKSTAGIKPRDVLTRPNRIDERRWYKFAAGESEESIALTEGVSPETISRSIQTMRSWQARHRNEVVALKINESFLHHLPEVDRAISGGLKAKKVIPLGQGKSKTVPDHIVQLKTVETLRSLQELAQPKVPLVNSNTQINVGGGVGPHYTAGTSFEARVRMLRERKGLTNGEGESVIDAEDDFDENVDETEEFLEDMAADSAEVVDADS